MLDSGRSQLYLAWQTLEGQWQSVEPHWRDQMAKRFIETVLAPLKEYSASALQAADQMEAILAQMKRDCGDPTNDLFSGE